MKSTNSDSGVNFKDVIKNFMKEKAWSEYKCDECGKTFFTKSANPINTTNCGWNGCKNKNHSFQKLSKKKIIIKPEEINQIVSKYFSLNGFEQKTPLNIANLNGLTDLIVAGVQMFDDVIHQNHKERPGKIYVSQPCIRMQFSEKIKELDGISTSFVNICTEQMGGSIIEHLESFDHWFTVLSKLGLFMNDFTIILRESDDNWGTGDFTKIELFYLYGDLELGDASYFEIPRKDQQPITISDIGFGLERISWAINKNKTYFDYLIPITFIGERDMFDSLRTLSLLLICGVNASNKGPGLQFRRFAKIISEKYYNVDVYEIIAFYYDYWSNFIDPVVTKNNAIRIARTEIERLVNQRICKLLDLPEPKHNEPTNAYLNRLVYTLNISIYEIREAIKVCKT